MAGYPSFPSLNGAAVEIPPPLTNEALKPVVERLWRHEQAIALALAGAAESGLDRISTETGSDGQALQSIAAALDVPLSHGEEHQLGTGSLAGAASAISRARLDWLLLERLALAAGAREIAGVASRAVQHKRFHAMAIERLAVATASLELLTPAEE